MDSLVYLCHRLPYPPNKGDKIRSYNVLRFLAARYRVYLGTFVDEDVDWQHVPILERLCEDVFALRLNPMMQRVKSITGLLRGEALSLPYYRDRSLQAWVDRTLVSKRVTSIVVFSSPMAQYVPARSDGVKSIVDFVDVDSEKWCQYAELKRRPMSWVYRRECERLLDYEREVALKASASLFVTAQEADLFRERAPDAAHSIHVIENGVDTDYFSPERTYSDPYRNGEIAVVFTGRMDYWANAEGVDWFARESFPLVRAANPNTRFYVVGSRPSAAVKRLASLSGVEVTGAVDDIRPYLAHARVVVAPLRIARGIQNKVLEALSMGRPVVATSSAFQGLDVPRLVKSRVADTARELALEVSKVIRAPGDAGVAGREWVLRNHAWSEMLKPLERLIG